MVSTPVAALMKGVLKAMFLNKLQTVLARLLLVAMIGVGGSWLPWQIAATAQDATSPAVGEKGKNKAPDPPNLAKVDRAIKKEPAYRAKPRYCLLVFGPQASARVWLVEDGETLYVDVNGNGDLTEPGEVFKPGERRKFGSFLDGKPVEYHQETYAIGDLNPLGGSGVQKAFKLVREQFGAKPADYVLSVHVEGVTLQYAGWGPLFAESRDTASVVHFGGPVIPQPVRRKTLSLKKADQTLHIRFGTPGLGKHSFASVGLEAVPKDVQPVAQIEWPVDAKAPAVKTTVTLVDRC
jgi:hypothetical protein